ncbi:LCP family protein [Enterococcus faecium]|nr:LCP family protein [Enterococcus faecium]EMF0359515.1 LCP family protein [Enterococcus faecium]
MNVLFILAADSQSCFYLLSLEKEKTLLRLGPDRVIANQPLGERYVEFDGEMNGFCRWLAEQLDLTIDHHVVLTQAALCDFLFAKEPTIEVRNPQAFTYHGHVTGTADIIDQKNCEEAFPKGPQSLDAAAFLRFITYQEDAPGVFGVFARQEHVLRLIKEQMLSSVNPTKILRKFNGLKKYIQTDLNISDLLKLFTAYQEGRGSKIKRITQTNSTDATLP